MRSALFISLFLVLTLLCGCSFSADHESGRSEVGMKPASPVTVPTHDELVESTEKLLFAAVESCQIMNDLAEQENVSKRGIRAAKKVNKKYGQRLSELADMKFSDLSDEELYKISEETSSMISAAREARDLLQDM